MRITTILGLLTLAALVGCGAKPKPAADDYYKEATAAFGEKNYDVAISRYKELLDQYPFSDHAEEVELRIAESYYRNKKYPEAIAAFNDFQRMHPMSPKLAKVYYLLGKSYMEQMTTIDRDQTAAESAHAWFQVVIERYPETRWARKARRHRAQCRESLAMHELYITSFYLRRKNLPAAENRAKGILQNYPETQTATRALEQLATAYEQAGDVEHARMARAALDERTAAFAGMTPESLSAGTVPAVTTPSTDTLIADLDLRYGPSDVPLNAPGAPTLVDPVASSGGGNPNDPRLGPTRGNESSPF